MVGRDEGGIIPELSDQQDAEVPAGTAAVLLVAAGSAGISGKPLRWFLLR